MRQTPQLELRRLGTVMRADSSRPEEVEGVCNPAAARTPDGDLLLFPRLVGAGNRSVVGCAKVLFDGDRPQEVQRLGIALEPTESWEQNPTTAGVEDPRITRIESLGAWVMCYTAYGPLGAKVAVAVSKDLRRWQRLGPVQYSYEPDLGSDFTMYPNKDAAFFPEPVRGPDGQSAYALLHRPFFDIGAMVPGAPTILPAGVTERRESIWVSYIPVSDVMRDIRALTRPGQHRPVAAPEYEWESLRIGAGPAPIRVDEGWLLLHHGVRQTDSGVEYCAGALLLDHDDVDQVQWRTAEPLLRPETDEELTGTVNRVVFPTAIDRPPGGPMDVYYGMADDKIGVARLSLG